LSADPFVRDSKRRIEVFSRLESHLARLAEVVRTLDPDAEVYLFGSVAEGRHLISSDVDVLVVTDRLRPGEVIASLKDEGFDDPFEIHVIGSELLDLYARRSKLVRL